MELLHVEPTKPRWSELANIHGIDVFMDGGPEYGKWIAHIELFGEIETETGQSPREAVVRLIHRLKLNGWQEVAV